MLAFGSRSLSRQSIWSVEQALLLLFVVSLFLPNYFYIGSVRLTAYRALLLLSIGPLVYYLSTGRSGRLRFADVTVFLICIWSSVALFVVQGAASSLEAVGIIWLETLGAYMLGRCLVRSPQQLFFVLKLFLTLALAISPFALYEAISGRNLLLEAFRLLGPTYGRGFIEPRWGLERVQSTFPHPIHFGVVILSLSGLAFYVVSPVLSNTRRLLRLIFLGGLGFLSLSSGPLVAFMTQLILIVWNGIFSRFRHRWWTFFVIFVLFYVFVDLLSNRTPFHVIIEYLSFNKETAYNRIRIWEFGSQSMWDNPWFGVGFGYWARPDWMSSSMDMFWLINGVRYGVIAWILWFIFFGSVFMPLLFRKLRSEKLSAYRIGYLITLAGLFFAGWTVHYWDTTYVFFLFLMGGGVWLVDYKEHSGEIDIESDENLIPRFSRFR